MTSPKSDLYSLGATLYEMVCGRPPFMGEESVAIITQHLNNPTHHPLLAPAREAFVRRAGETGRFQRAEEAVQEALSLWEERERRRVEILATVDRAEASLARGEGLPVSGKSMGKLADEVKRRGRTRLEKGQTAAR